jgi:hypothetical protein
MIFLGGRVFGSEVAEINNNLYLPSPPQSSRAYCYLPNLACMFV